MERSSEEKVLNFFLMVRTMREQQRRYFATKSKDSLIRAKQLEAKVDELLKVLCPYTQEPD